MKGYLTRKNTRFIAARNGFWPPNLIHTLFVVTPETLLPKIEDPGVNYERQYLDLGLEKIFPEKFGVWIGVKSLSALYAQFSRLHHFEQSLRRLVLRIL